jgi:hypothetical protein
LLMPGTTYSNLLFIRLDLDCMAAAYGHL